MIKIVTVFVLAVLGLYAGAHAQVNEAEDRVVALVKKLGGEVTRDDKAPSKPIVIVRLPYDRVAVAVLRELASLKNLNTLYLESKPLYPKISQPFLANSAFSEVTDADLKELAALKNLTTLYLERALVTDAVLKVLREINLLHVLSAATTVDGKRPTKAEDVAVFDLQETEVTDAGLKELATIKNLTTLDLSKTRVTDAGLKELATLKNLTTLDLNKTRVTDAGLKELATLKNLTTLNLRHTRGVTDVGLKELATLKNLTNLDLFDTEVRDVGLKELAALKNLTTLNLYVTDAVLKVLREINLLHALSIATTVDGKRPTKAEDVARIKLSYLSGKQLYGIIVTDAGLKELATLKNLTTLDLDREYVTDAVLKVLREINLLHVLSAAKTVDGKRPTKVEDVAEFDLRETRVTDAGLKELAILKNLTMLNLSHTWGVSGRGLKELATLKNLNSLYLYNTYVTDAGLKELITLKSLTTLSLWGYQVTDEGLKELAGLKSLTTLNLHHTRVTDASLKELAALKNLTTLDLRVTDAVLKVLREINLLHVLSAATTVDGKRPTKAEDVAKFNLRETRVTDAGLKELATLKNLTTLDLSETQVTDAGFKELQKALPNLSR